MDTRESKRRVQWSYQNGRLTRRKLGLSLIFSLRAICWGRGGGQTGKTWERNKTRKMQAKNSAKNRKSTNEGQDGTFFRQEVYKRVRISRDEKPGGRKNCHVGISHVQRANQFLN